jgi:hypothetical protein
MTDSQYIDWITWRVHLYEKCYLKGYNSLLFDITLDSDDVFNRHMHDYDGEMAQRKMEGAAERMRQNLEKLNKHYSTIPFERFECDACAEHISVIRDLWMAYSRNIAEIVDGNTDTARYTNLDRGIGVCIDSILRCMSLERIDARILSEVREGLPAIVIGCVLAQEDEDIKRDIGDHLKVTGRDVEKLFGAMLEKKGCDAGFAPLSVTRFLLDDYKFWIGQLIDEPSEEAYMKVNLLSAGLRQVGHLYKARFKSVLKRFHKIPGHDGFKVCVRDFEGKQYVARDIYQL